MYEQIATFSANHACAHSPCDDRSGSHWSGTGMAARIPLSMGIICTDADRRAGGTPGRERHQRCV